SIRDENAKNGWVARLIVCKGLAKNVKAAVKKEFKRILDMNEKSRPFAMFDRRKELWFKTIPNAVFVEHYGVENDDCVVFSWGDEEGVQWTLGQLRNLMADVAGLRKQRKLLLFPEGTDRGVRAAAQSNVYAKQNGLPRYDYVLHPRTTGFNYLLNVMRSENYISCVYDITVAYEDVIIDSEMSLLKGIFPKNIHFNVKKYDIKEIPSDPEESGIWLKELWREKEEALKKFYESEPHKRRLDPSGVGYMFPVRTEGIGYYVAFTFWILMTAALMTYIFGAKVHIRGDKIDHSKPALIIMNHRTRIDSKRLLYQEGDR
ncbi:hypothetical protein TELCIR_15143, partial [Teladorsagia circumcincta]